MMFYKGDRHVCDEVVEFSFKEDKFRSKGRLTRGRFLRWGHSGLEDHGRWLVVVVVVRTQRSTTELWVTV